MNKILIALAALVATAFIACGGGGELDVATDGTPVTINEDGSIAMDFTIGDITVAAECWQAIDEYNAQAGEVQYYYTDDLGDDFYAWAEVNDLDLTVCDD